MKNCIKRWGASLSNMAQPQVLVVNNVSRVNNATSKSSHTVIHNSTVRDANNKKPKQPQTDIPRGVRVLKFNSFYLRTNRGLIKILQLIAAVAIVCFILLTHSSQQKLNQKGDNTTDTTGSTASDIRPIVCCGISALILISNSVILFMNILSTSSWAMERLCAIISCGLCFILIGVCVWMLTDEGHKPFLIIALVFVVVEVILTIWDIRILVAELLR